MTALFIILHIIICLILYLLIRAGILKCSRMVMMLVWFVPVWGVLCLLVLEIRTRGNQENREEVQIEKLKINDEIHRSILMEDLNEGKVVPLSEALLMNDAAMRRELMMGILYGNPDDYVEQLQEARMNDDTEVVHYAVTALVELQKNYEIQFQELEYRMKKAPEDQEPVREYLKLMERYLASGLPEGNAEVVLRRRYTELLGQYIRQNGEHIVPYCKKAEASLKIGEYGDAYEEIETIIYKWPRDERGYLLMIQYYAQMKDRTGITRTLELLEKRGVHLSSRGRGAVRFWGTDEGMVNAGK